VIIVAVIVVVLIAAVAAVVSVAPVVGIAADIGPAIAIVVLFINADVDGVRPAPPGDDDGMVVAPAPNVTVGTDRPTERAVLVTCKRPGLRGRARQRGRERSMSARRQDEGSGASRTVSGCGVASTVTVMQSRSLASVT
jgi:hypothetical protein